MKYSLEFDIDQKPAIVPLNLKIAEPIVRQFKSLTKETGRTMSHVMTKMMLEFIEDHTNKKARVPRQREMF